MFYSKFEASCCYHCVKSFYFFFADGDDGYPSGVQMLLLLLKKMKMEQNLNLKYKVEVYYENWEKIQFESFFLTMQLFRSAVMFRVICNRSNSGWLVLQFQLLQGGYINKLEAFNQPTHQLFDSNSCHLQSPSYKIHLIITLINLICRWKWIQSLNS